MLESPQLRGSVLANAFETETAAVKKQCKRELEEDKAEGLCMLMQKLGQTVSLEEQLALFSSKC